MAGKNSKAITIPEFESDDERYEWELGQRFYCMDKLDRWVSAAGIHTIGPPIPPGAAVFHGGTSPTEAFTKADKEGYLACQPAADFIGCGRKTVRRMVDRFDSLNVAYSTYDGKVKGTRYHCRMVRKKDLRMLKKQFKERIARMEKGGNKKTTAANIRRTS
jgi:hypothetical protein